MLMQITVITLLASSYLEIYYNDFRCKMNMKFKLSMKQISVLKNYD